MGILNEFTSDTHIANLRQKGFSDALPPDSALSHCVHEIAEQDSSVHAVYPIDEILSQLPLFASSFQHSEPRSCEQPAELIVRADGNQNCHISPQDENMFTLGTQNVPGVHQYHANVNSFQPLVSENIASPRAHAESMRIPEQAEFHSLDIESIESLLSNTQVQCSNEHSSSAGLPHQSVAVDCSQPAPLHQGHHSEGRNARSNTFYASWALPCKASIKKERASHLVTLQPCHLPAQQNALNKNLDVLNRITSTPTTSHTASETKPSKPWPSLRPKIRRYSRATPSRFCHICARSMDIVELLPCRNVQYGVCRKTVCLKCFQDQGWNWDEAIANPNAFSCSHCTRTCPPNAQCRTYQRTNERRRLVCMKKRMLIEDALANGGDVEAVLALNQIE